MRHSREELLETLQSSLQTLQEGGDSAKLIEGQGTEVTQNVDRDMQQRTKQLGTIYISWTVRNNIKIDT